MYAVSIFQATSCIYLLYRCLIALNSMGRITRMAVRLAYWVLSAAAFFGVLNALSGKPDIVACLMALGIVLYLLVSKRKPRHVA